MAKRRVGGATTKDQRREEVGRKSNLKRIRVGIAIAILLVTIGGLLYVALQEPEGLEGLARIAGLSRDHSDNPQYDDDGLPPVGGTHSGYWQNCGIYSEPIDGKHAVHSMEHGAVWVTYQPDLAAAEVAMLRDLLRGHSYVILSPFEGLNSPVVLSAWGVQLEVDSAADERVATFIDRYEQGPQTPELGASCQNGIGAPIG